MTCFTQVDVETICFGRHTFFVIADFIGTVSTSCSIASFLRKCCCFHFWVWHKLEGHHLGCKYFESCFALFSPSLLQSRSFSTRFLLATTDICGEAWLEYIRILNLIWLHMHPTIIHEYIKTRILAIPLGNRFIEWRIITLTWTKIWLLMMFRWWFRILDFVWASLLLLVDSLLIFS